LILLLKLFLLVVWMILGFSIIETSDNSFFKFVFILKFIDNGPSHEVYKERFKLLKPLYENTKVSIKTDNRKIISSYDDEKIVQLKFGQNY